MAKHNWHRSILRGLFWGAGVFVVSFVLTMMMGFTFRYAVQVIIGIVFLVCCMVKGCAEHWSGLFLYEGIACVVARCYATYYDSLPGYGIMPGLSYAEETFSSLFAHWAFLLLIVISALLCLMKRRRRAE